jgi:AbrB family looped-hinge helix DNA binding protein
MIYYKYRSSHQEEGMYTAKVSSKGWVVIPKDLREKYGIRGGTRVQVVEYGDVLALVPVPQNPAKALYGLLQDGPSLTAELLQQRTRDRAREDEEYA